MRTSARPRAFATWSAALALALAPILGSAAETAPSAVPAQLRIGYQKSSVNLLVARELGLLESRFPGVRVRWSEFPAGPQLLEALGAGSLDFGATGDTPPVFAQAAGSDVVYVGAEPPKPRNSAILVAPDSPIHALGDLRGKRVAFQKGSSAHYLVLRAVQQAGLRYADIVPVYLTPADGRAAFQNGSVDAWSIWDPYWAAAQQDTPARTLVTGEGLTANDTFYLSSRRFLGRYPGVVAGLLDALGAADRHVQAHADEAALLVSRATGLAPAAAHTYLQRRPPSPVAPLGPEVVARQQALADSYAAAGLIPRAIDVADAVWGAASARATRQGPASAGAGLAHAPQ
jgi:sulfonate transport system substrate-binding protein